MCFKQGEFKNTTKQVFKQDFVESKLRKARQQSR
jgi:hypothetical protein